MMQKSNLSDLNEIQDATHVAKLDRLRELILTIEGFLPLTSKNNTQCESFLLSQAPWRFGLSEIDDNLPWGGLAIGLHEVLPEDYRDTGAAMAFALALIARLTQVDDKTLILPTVLWCATTQAMREFGRPYGPGLSGLGVDPAHVIVVETARAQETAWAMEEGLKSGDVLAVLGVLPNLKPGPAKRLALAAQTHRTPCLAVESCAAPGLSPALTRWRVASRASSAPPFDARAPGSPAWRLSLERCRHGVEHQHWTVEWLQNAHCFNMVAPFSAGAAEAIGPHGGPMRRTGGA
jgi:protein ImuA